jgi:hypothetical protein
MALPVKLLPSPNTLTALASTDRGYDPHPKITFPEINTNELLAKLMPLAALLYIVQPVMVELIIDNCRAAALA